MLAEPERFSLVPRPGVSASALPSCCELSSLARLNGRDPAESSMVSAGLNNSELSSLLEDVEQCNSRTAMENFKILNFKFAKPYLSYSISGLALPLFTNALSQTPARCW
jgi:hypothetical protein